MKSYRRLQKFIVVVLLVYVSIGYGFHALKLRELFPMFSWELFSFVPARNRVDFGMLITRVNGEELPEPVYFEEAESFLSEAHTIQAYGSIQLFAVAIVKNDEAETERIRSYFESLFFDEIDSISYQIVRRRVDLLSLWETGEYDEETLLAAFEKGE
jgi:hypothetical protein